MRQVEREVHNTITNTFKTIEQKYVYNYLIFQIAKTCVHVSLNAGHYYFKFHGMQFPYSALQRLHFRH